MIHGQDLTRTYQSANRILALNKVNLSIERGERVAIVGKSGSGKTTLLNVLAGLDRLTSGSLKVDGSDLSTMNPRELAVYRSRTIGVIFQSFQLIGQRTAAQNVELPLIITSVDRRTRRDRTLEALKQVGLEHRASHRPCELSGGEQQRVAIARAIIAAPKVLLADEPTGNLDSTTADEVRELMLQVCDLQNMTLVLVTHDSELAATCASRVLRMHDGSLHEVVDA